ncbi:hypothetical protein WMY93_031798 [Mugilogobius chulae]|uniref:G-protein coupled receptors family 1 profile domain-containing protein n=1 Tax=Mugilogobius chulae TaxID=88201 RepID=A0AAW0MLP7_9GOBI
MNSSSPPPSSPPLSPSFFVLHAYVWIGPWRFPCFVLTLLLYVSILLLNALLIALIGLRRSLQEPMHLFLVSLFVNEIYGSTFLFPALLVQLLRRRPRVSVSACFLQIFGLYTYVNVQYCNLTVMAYDRYLAVCFPLKYAVLMSSSRVVRVVVSVWCYCFLRELITAALNLRLTFCGDALDSLYCHNFLVARLACSGSALVHVYGLLMTVLCVALPLALLLFSYARILRVCLAGSAQARQKALSTCLPHAVSLLNFSFGGVFAIAQSRLDLSAWPAALRIVLSLYFIVLQPLLNPLVYGLRLKQTRRCETQLHPEDDHLLSRCHFTENSTCQTYVAPGRRENVTAALWPCLPRVLAWVQCRRVWSWILTRATTSFPVGRGVCPLEEGLGDYDEEDDEGCYEEDVASIFVTDVPHQRWTCCQSCSRWCPGRWRSRSRLNLLYRWKTSPRGGGGRSGRKCKSPVLCPQMCIFKYATRDSSQPGSRRRVVPRIASSWTGILPIEDGVGSLCCHLRSWTHAMRTQHKSLL